MSHLPGAASLVFGLSIMGAATTAFAGEGTTAQPEAAGDPTAPVVGAPPVEDGADSGATDDPYEDPLDSPPPEEDDEYADDATVSASGSAGTSNGTVVAAEGSASESSGTGIDPFKGRFAVGAIRTIAGLNGINFRYFVADKLSVGASTGIALFAYKENDPASMDVCPGDDCTFEDNRTVAALAFNAEVLYWAKLGRPAGTLPFRADFGLGGRFGVISIINASDIADNLDDPLELHIEIPLVIQLMFGNNFSLAPELGMDFRIVPGSREAGDSNPGTGFPPTVSGDAVTGPGFGWEITPGVGLFAGASLHYYFGGS